MVEAITNSAANAEFMKLCFISLELKRKWFFGDGGKDANTDKD